ncbi:MAG: hypothetical protein V1933_07065 [Candidatus Omnitrophota bacterium]
MSNKNVAEKKIGLVNFGLPLFLGIFFLIWPGIVFSAVLTIFVFYLIAGNVDSKDKKFVILICLIAVALRLAIFIPGQYYCFSKGRLDIFGDGQDNLLQGAVFSDHLKEGFAGKPYFAFDRYNTHGKTVFNLLFFYLFGMDVISLKYLNILCVVISGWFTYDIAKSISSSSAARIAMSAVLLWPTLILWSVTDLKESHFILSILIMLWSFNKLINETGVKRRVFLSFLLLASAFYTVSLKFKFMLPLVVLTLAISFIYFYARRRFAENRKVALKFIFAGLIAAAFLFFWKKALISQIFNSYYDIIIAYHRGFLDSGGWNYSLIGELNQTVYTAPFFIKYVLSAWFHFLMEPLPWHVYSLGIAVIFPMTIIWYLMLTLAFMGAIKVYKSGKADLIFTPLLFMFLYASVVGMSIANIGTAVRFRDAIMPIVAILASCGLMKFKNNEAFNVEL